MRVVACDSHNRAGLAQITAMLMAGAKEASTAFSQVQDIIRSLDKVRVRRCAACAGGGRVVPHNVALGAGRDVHSIRMAMAV